MSASESAGIVPSGRRAVGEEGAGAGDALVEAGRQLEPVAARVLARADERAQRDRVVVRGGLAVDAVGVEVGREVAVELGDRRARRASSSGNARPAISSA